MMKTALVTGATGFIGGHLLKALIARGVALRALVLPGDQAGPALEKKGITVIYGDIRDYEKVRLAAGKVDVIFHCAALVTDWAPGKLFKEVIAGGAENICRAALESRVSRLVDISTNDVFGLDEDKIMDESCELKPWKEPYPDYKIESEKTMWRYYREHNLPVTMVYPCWVYGPDDYTFTVDVADAIVKKDMLFWRKNVLVWPTYVENLVDLLILIAEDKRSPGRGFLVHDGESTTLQEFTAGIAVALDVKKPALHIPFRLAFAIALVMETIWKLFRVKTRPLLTTYIVKNLGSRLKFSIIKAERELGWKPKISYKEGFARTMEWLKTLDRNNLRTR